jgi:hypothetical protein
MTYHPRFGTVASARGILCPLDPSNGIIDVRDATTTPVGRGSTISELRAAYERLADRFPDETPSRDLLVGGDCMHKRTAGLLVVFVALLIAIVGRWALGQ